MIRGGNVEAKRTVKAGDASTVSAEIEHLSRYAVDR